MKRAALIMAVVGVAAGAAWGAPTYQYSAVDLGGGLYGFTFTCDNTGAPASAWFVEMEWRGMTQAEVDQHCLCTGPGMDPSCQWVPGAIPGTIIQTRAFGLVTVDCEPEAIAYHNPSPPASYDMYLDTWVTSEFCHSFQGGTPIEGPNSYYVESGTKAGTQYVTVDHAYVVVDGSFIYEGRLGVGLVNPVWTPVIGYVCIVPEPGALVLLVIGAAALLRRRR